MKNFSKTIKTSWVEVDLSRLKSNFLQLKSLLKPETKIIAVVKANAYGHGAPLIAKTLEKNGAFMFAVVTLGEALDLKLTGIKKPILIMRRISPEGAELAIKQGFRVALSDKELMKALVLAAKRNKKKAYVHIKIETGMIRWGLLPSKVLQFMKEIKRHPEIKVEGIFSHFATADEAKKDFAKEQLKIFLQTTENLKKAGYHIPLRHIANSAATLDMPETHLEAVRPGTILYGYQPSLEILNPLKIEPILELKSKIGRVAKIEPKTSVSYGRTWRASRKSLIATMPIGYADGYNRGLSNKGEVILRGRRVKIVGLVNMDNTMIDVTSFKNVKEGEEVVLIGRQGKEALWSEEMADLLDTNFAEILAGISQRLPRFYLEKGKIVDVIGLAGGYYYSFNKIKKYESRRNL